MYYPYFRGKQFELIAIRETAKLLASSGFTPIIEPVRNSLAGLERAISAISEFNGKAIIIVNPLYGDHSQDGNEISDFLKTKYEDDESILAGIVLTEETEIADAISIYNQHSNNRPVFIHAGFTEAKSLVTALESCEITTSHIFLERNCGKPYRRHFNKSERILLRDGFKKRRNADHPPVELFSDLHVTYTEEGMQGFGDFLIVGDDYSEGGGPAYAVAIHLTFIDPDKDDVMYIYHFVSDSKDTPTDPAGKFAQALKKLIEKLDSGNSNIYETEAIKEFRALHGKQHFPGLGTVKKLSMKHHIETMAKFFE